MPSVSQDSCCGSMNTRDGSSSAAVSTPTSGPAVPGTAALRFCRVSMTDRSASGPKEKRRKKRMPLWGSDWSGTRIGIHSR